MLKHASLDCISSFWHIRHNYFFIYFTGYWNTVDEIEVLFNVHA